MADRLLWAVLALAAAAATAAQERPRRVVVASKNFTESVLLGELMAQAIEAHTDLHVVRRLGLGGTRVCWTALRSGEVDLYADYTGTGWAIVLKEPGRIRDPLQAYLHVRRRYLEEFGVRWLLPFGLDNTYAIAVPEPTAERLDLRTISDLGARGGALRAGFSIEFMNREDGWPGLRAAYDLELGSVTAVEHGLAYAAVAAGDLDVIDAYSTDGKLLRYRLRVLADDRGFFPPYHAAPLVRQDTLDAFPELERALDHLAFRVTDREIQQLNLRVEEDGEAFAAVAADFLAGAGIASAAPGPAAPRRRPGLTGLAEMLRDRAGITLDLLLEHLLLTAVAVALAAAAAIPLGIVISTRPRLRRITLGIAGVLQTIPSLALLAFMIPLLGLDVRAAIAALFLYALLPIVRNTYTGVTGIDPELIDAARGIGMRERQILRIVRLPLAAPTIMAGVRTATVISIGVATLAAFIGAGGLGVPIVTGLYLDDTNLILCGAIPAALLALATDAALGLLERRLSPSAGAEADPVNAAG